jgi:stage V sporulation protein K
VRTNFFVSSSFVIISFNLVLFIFFTFLFFDEAYSLVNPDMPNDFGTEAVDALVDELNGMVGLSEVKEEIQSLINLIKIRKLREEMDMPVMDMSYHMVFTGSPGTGKTTVARLVGKIYKELGILSDGKMIETDRSGLVAGYVGQTAMKVHDVVKEAMGGILFIDEAYSLVNPDMPNDFGTEAVDALVKLMEDNRDNLVIIVAGYTEEMKTFLKSNTGLVSRFNKFINFPDYTKEELVSILSVMAGKAGQIRYFLLHHRSIHM